MLPFLPALIGAGLQTGLGLTALKAGLITGLGTAIATKDIGKGITAGLGAYGGAGITEGLGQAGQIGATAVDAGTPIAAGKTIATPEAAKTGYQALGTAGERAASIGRGVSALGDPVALQAAGGGGSLAMSGLTALTPTLETEMDMPQSDPAMIRPSSYDPATGMFTDLPPYPAKQGGVVPGLESQVRMQTGGMTGLPTPMPQSRMFEPMENRMVSGRGDGMSDSVSGTIDGEQGVRLSVDEFVVPADVVSGLGNGSTTAGAKKLYNMMDNVREERTGRTRQAPEVDAARLMPA